jgi:hypothetical protein
MIDRKDKNEMIMWAVKYDAAEVLKHFIALGVEALVLEEAAKLTSNQEMLSIITTELGRLKNDSSL